MEKIEINTPGYRSEIIIGKKWESVSELIPYEKTVIITDDNVKKLYGSNFPKVTVFSLSPGERSKKLGVIEDMAGKLLDAGIDRSGFILAIGGGVVCDFAGFLASVYMRGIRCGYVSSTLLSQVDASSGGKNGVNLGNTKNMIGTFRQPEFVICDTAMLQTLPGEEYLSGLAEMIKTAVIGDKDLFEMLENRSDDILSRNPGLLAMLVARSLRFKGSVVSEDEKETGLRRILNFGHTYGHAIELQKAVKHGFAVAAGMEISTDFSLERGYISRNDRDRIIYLLKRFTLIGKLELTDDQMRNLLVHDKKKSGQDIYFVFTQGIGKAKVEKVPVADVLGFYKRFRDKKTEL